MVKNMDKTADYCSIKEASQILGVSPKTIQLWVENGNLRAWKTAGGHRRVIRESVQALMDARQPGAVKAPSSHAGQGGGPGSHVLRVLIVEDEEVLRRMYEFNVKQWRDSIHIEMAKDGFEALLKIGNAKPHVLITDLSMPGMDGFKMLRRLYELEQLGSMLVIVITSYDSDTLVSLGRLPDGVHVFEKPAPFKAIKLLVNSTVLHKLPI